MIAAGFVQGMGVGMMFVPISSVIFATLAPQYRYEGAALNSLIRNLGGSVGISVLQTLTMRGEATVHARLVEQIRPDSPLVTAQWPWLDFIAGRPMAAMDIEVARQALMVSYVNAFWLLAFACAVIAPLTLFVRPLRKN